MAFITLEEHYVSQWLCQDGKYDHFIENSCPSLAKQKLLVIDQMRVGGMNTTSIKKQIISHVSFSNAIKTHDFRQENEALHAAIRTYPSHFAGFALLSIDDPAAAALELKYCVKTLGFVSALVGNALKDSSFFDSTQYDVLFVMFAELDVPRYLHPTYVRIRGVIQCTI